MNPQLESLVDSIFKKLKGYKPKEIFLKKESLEKYIFLLLK